MSQFKTATLFLKPETPEAATHAAGLCALLKAENIQPLNVVDEGSIFNTELKEAENISIQEIPQTENVCFVLGGDGTFLTAARALYGNGSPLCGINFGHLGFLAETEVEQIEGLVQDIVKGNTVTEQRPYFLFSTSENKQPQPFVNDVVLARNAEEKMLHFSVDVEKEEIFTSRADGLIISTPTGSTAYNLSSGGPILEPTLDALVLSPICPHTLSHRPVVIPTHKEVCIKLHSEAGHLSIDGQATLLLEKGVITQIQKAEHKLKVLHQKGRNFYSLLNKKMGWHK